MYHDSWQTSGFAEQVHEQGLPGEWATSTNAIATSTLCPVPFLLSRLQANPFPNIKCSLKRSIEQEHF